jgi:hypothetical protein
MSNSALKTNELDSWIALLEMFSDKESLLQGAAGEDAMNVGDVLKITRYARHLAETLMDCIGGWHDIDPRIKYVEVQLDKDELRRIHRLLGVPEPKFK